MENLRFGCVHWRVSMTDILCALENAEGQWSQEISWCQETSSWSQCEASVGFQEVVHLLQLWNSVLFKDLLLFKSIEDHVVFAASVFWHQILDNVENWSPCVVFGFGVFDVGNWVTAAGRNLSVKIFKNFIFQQKLTIYKQMQLRRWAFCVICTPCQRILDGSCQDQVRTWSSNGCSYPIPKHV